MAVARAALPHESCGLVSGHVDFAGLDGDVAILALHPVANAARSPTSFSLDGHQMIAAEEAIERAGHVLIGVMHSHPTSAALPSARDLADARVYDPNSNLVHLIVSMQGFVPTLRAFRYDPDGSDPTEFEVIAGP